MAGFRDKFDILGRCVRTVNMETYTTRCGCELTRFDDRQLPDIFTFILAETSTCSTRAVKIFIWITLGVQSEQYQFRILKCLTQSVFQALPAEIQV
jgi:hypothetical protein